MKLLITTMALILFTSHSFAWLGSTGKVFSLSDIGQTIEISGSSLSCSMSPYYRDRIEVKSITSPENVKPGPALSETDFLSADLTCEELAQEAAKNNGHLTGQIISVDASEQVQVVRRLGEEISTGEMDYKYKAEYNKYQQIEAVFQLGNNKFKVPLINYTAVGVRGILYGSVTFL